MSSKESCSVEQVGGKKILGKDGNLFWCDQCSAMFSCAWQLKRHLGGVSHRGREGLQQMAKTWLCEWCGATFHMKHSLSRHKKSHESPELYTCSFCTYSTKDQSNMKSHVRRHFESCRNYVCEVCGFAFHARSTLQVHKDFKHSTIRQFGCSHCSETFKTKSSLSRHSKVHEDKAQYVCWCGRGFKLKYNFHRHITLIHGETYKRHQLLPVDSSRKCPDSGSKINIGKISCLKTTGGFKRSYTGNSNTLTNNNADVNINSGYKQTEEGGGKDFLQTLADSGESTKPDTKFELSNTKSHSVTSDNSNEFQGFIWGFEHVTPLALSSRIEPVITDNSPIFARVLFSGLTGEFESRNSLCRLNQASYSMLQHQRPNQTIAVGSDYTLNRNTCNESTASLAMCQDITSNGCATVVGNYTLGDRNDGSMANFNMSQDIISKDTSALGYDDGFLDRNGGSMANFNLSQDMNLKDSSAVGPDNGLVDRNGGSMANFNLSQDMNLKDSSTVGPDNGLVDRNGGSMANFNLSQDMILNGCSAVSLDNTLVDRNDGNMANYKEFQVLNSNHGSAVGSAKRLGEKNDGSRANVKVSKVMTPNGCTSVGINHALVDRNGGSRANFHMCQCSNFHATATSECDIAAQSDASTNMCTYNGNCLTWKTLQNCSVNTHDKEDSYNTASLYNTVQNQNATIYQQGNHDDSSTKQNIFPRRQYLHVHDDLSSHSPQMQVEQTWSQDIYLLSQLNHFHLPIDLYGITNNNEVYDNSMGNCSTANNTSGTWSKDTNNNNNITNNVINCKSDNNVTISSNNTNLPWADLSEYRI